MAITPSLGVRTDNRVKPTACKKQRRFIPPACRQCDYHGTDAGRHRWTSYSRLVVDKGECKRGEG